jgi:hypothetical protein
LGTAPAITLLTGYAYDQFNHLQQVRLRHGHQPPASATNPESGMIPYVYNADSTLSTKTYNNGNYQQYSYDAYQRLTEIQGFVYNSPQHYTEDASERQTFIYDSLNGVSYPGLLTEATFASGLDTTNAWTLQNQYTYTAAGQVATKALSVSNGAATASGLLTTSYTYDGLGTLISTQYPSPNSLTFTYALDGLERPIGLTDNTNHTWVSGVLYNPASQMTNATFPSGTETWGYNLLNQLMQRTTTSGSTTRMNMAYNYTAGKDNGQIAGSADAVTGETITYLFFRTPARTCRAAQARRRAPSPTIPPRNFWPRPPIPRTA